jgi:hypothetical protein
MAQAFKRYSMAQQAAKGRPIVKIDDLFIVIERDPESMALSEVSLLAPGGGYEATITLRSLAKLGNGNYATPGNVKFGTGYGADMFKN